MNVYFSVDPEAAGGESAKNLKKLMKFLQAEGHRIYRAEYVYSDDPDLYSTPRKQYGYYNSLSAVC